jgi:hypothetical protein
MNGFTNTILSLLLGWVRTFFNAVWALLDSDGGGSFLAFVSGHWKTIFIFMCVGGFVVDRLIYLVRWRPYYVWRSKRRMRKRRRSTGAQAGGEGRYAQRTEARPQASARQEPPPDDGAFAEATVRYRPAGTPGFAPAYRYQSPAAGAYASDFRPLPEETRTYAVPPPDALSGNAPAPNAYAPSPPDASFAPTIAYGSPFRAPVAAEPLANEPRFDDDLAPWGDAKAGFRSFAPSVRPEISAEPAPALGSPAVSGQDRYLKDVQSGFAPPLTPEALFAPRSEAAGEPLHPGLDMQAFQQSLGLGGAETRPVETRDQREAYADFAPFPETSQAGDSTPKTRMLGTLAKKARTFVSGEDEANPPTIRDLQPTVDMTNAFRAPVYPKKRQEGGDKP